MPIPSPDKSLSHHGRTDAIAAANSRIRTNGLPGRWADDGRLLGPRLRNTASFRKIRSPQSSSIGRISGEGKETYEGIVGRDDCDDVNPSTFEFRVFFDEGREMFGLTSRSESTRESKQYYFLSFEFLNNLATRVV